MVLVPRLASVFSILGSLYIIQHVLRSKKRLGRIYHRLLLGLSANDCLFALYSFLGNWPAPAEGPFHGTAGNQLSCTMHGFLGQGTGLVSILYSGSLTIFFLFLISGRTSQTRSSCSRTSRWPWPSTATGRSSSWRARSSGAVPSWEGRTRC